MGGIPSSAKRCVPFQFIRLNIMEIIQKLFGYGSIPIHTIFCGLFTSINPSYFGLFWGSLGTRVLTHLVSWNEVRPEVRGQRAASPMLEWISAERRSSCCDPGCHVVLLHVIMQLRKMFGITATFNTFYCFFPAKFVQVHPCSHRLDVHQNDDASNEAVAQRFKMSC